MFIYIAKKGCGANSTEFQIAYLSKGNREVENDKHLYMNNRRANKISLIEGACYRMLVTIEDVANIFQI